VEVSPCLYQKRDPLGNLLPVWVCRNSLTEYGSPECIDYMMGMCRPRVHDIPKSRRKHRRRYHKFDVSQVDLCNESVDGFFPRREEGVV